MAPTASRFAATGMALGLASTFVLPAPTKSTESTALRGSTVERPTTQGSNHLATLAAASVCATAMGVGHTRVQAKAFQPSQQIGASEPLGFFDPLGFTSVGDEQGFKKLRAAEIKHGRLAMMASIGFVAQHYVKLPGFENLPSGFSILGKQEGVLGLFALFLVSGCLENLWREDGTGAREPGNFGDPFGLQMYTEEMRMKELNNGRMAMMSVLGIFAAEMATGKDAIQQFGLSAIGSKVATSSRSSFAGKTSSTVPQRSVITRAFQPSQQIGASEPLGFFDPLGFTSVGDEQGFKKLRAAEIKHGRLAMMASIGFVAQHYVKLPGFESLPSGFSILGKQEGVLGLFALFLVSGCLENLWREDATGAREPGNFGDPFGLQMYTEEMRMKELNNGRMAMMSVLGIFAAEMATGKDAIQQFGL